MPHLSSCCGTEAAGAPHRRQRTCQTIRARDRYFAGSNERRTKECLGAAPAQRRERRIHAACRRVKSEEVAKPGPKFSEDGEHGTAGSRACSSRGPHGLRRPVGHARRARRRSKGGARRVLGGGVNARTVSLKSSPKVATRELVTERFPISQIAESGCVAHERTEQGTSSRGQLSCQTQRSRSSEKAAGLREMQ